MNTLDSKLDDVVDLLNKIEGAPAILLVLLACICMGYVLRFIKKFPNDAIPLVVILTGAVLLPLLSDFRESQLPLRIWIIRNLVVGLIIGCGAWAMHYYILSKVEDAAIAKFPWIGKILNQTDNGGSGQASQPTEQPKQQEQLAAQK